MFLIFWLFELNFFFTFYIFRGIKMATVTKAVDKVVTRRSKRQEEDQEYKDVKPLIVTKQLPSVSPQVKMEVLKLKPLHHVQRIQKARCGLPFNPGSCPGQKRGNLQMQCKVSEKPEKLDSKKSKDNKSVDKESKPKQKDDGSGDASVELDEMPYEEWLAKHGLQSESENIHKIDEVDNKEKFSDLESKLVKYDNDGEVECDNAIDESVSKDETEETDQKTMLISKMDKMRKDVEELLAKDNGEADRIKTLKTILQLLEEDEENKADLKKKKEEFECKEQEEEVACKKKEEEVEENECKKMDEHKKVEALKKAEDAEAKEIQELMKKQKAELEIKQEKEKQDLIEKERIACKKEKEELAKRRVEECEKMKENQAEDNMTGR